MTTIVLADDHHIVRQGLRVLIESGDAHERWGTVGVSHNVIEASWQALVDSFEYKLFKDEAK
jgi:2-isopropylmalate synthase